jgi:hypothetical protein
MKYSEFVKFTQKIIIPTYFETQYANILLLFEISWILEVEFPNFLPNGRNHMENRVGKIGQTTPELESSPSASTSAHVLLRNNG